MPNTTKKTKTRTVATGTSRQRVIGTPAQEHARGERNARMQALRQAEAIREYGRLARSC